MPATLNSARRSELRAEAHKLKPLVLIGDKGLTDAVIAEADGALKAHELIKVRASTDDREARKAWMEELATRLEAHAVQVIGKILVLYRENVEKREAEKAAAKAAARLAARPRTKRPARERAAPKPETTGKVRTKAGKKPSLWTKKPRDPGAATGTSRRQSRTPSPRPASGPRRRPRSTSR